MRNGMVDLQTIKRKKKNQEQKWIFICKKTEIVQRTVFQQLDSCRKRLQYV